NPRLTLWIEILTIAHLVGKPAPQPDTAWLTDLKNSSDQRTLECALAHCIHTSITTRYIGLAAYYPPEHLATHLTCVASAHLESSGSACDGSETGWQAGRYRWIDIAHALQNDNTDKNTPHPDTLRWAQRGLRLTGRTQTEQLQQLQQHPDC